MYEALQEAFADHWDFHPQPLGNWREFIVKARNFDPDLWLVAWDGDELAGASLDYPERSDDPGHGWIGTLGVRRPWRRRGLGEALLRRSFAALHARGQRKVRLGRRRGESDRRDAAVRARRACSVLRQSNTWDAAQTRELS